MLSLDFSHTLKAHVLEDCIPPVCIAVLGMNLSGFLYRLWNPDAEFMCLKPRMLGFHCCKNPVPLFKRVWSPQGKGVFLCYAPARHIWRILLDNMLLSCPSGTQVVSDLSIGLEAPNQPKRSLSVSQSPFGWR